MELLKIVNTSPNKPLTLKHARHGDVTIPPDTAIVLPDDYAFVSFGNPQTQGEDREHEVAYLKRYWGFYPGITPDRAWHERVPVPEIGRSPFQVPEPGEDDIMVGPLCPQFEAYAQDGTRVWFPLDDPDGSRASGASTNARDLSGASADFLEQKIAEMTKQQEQLLAQLAALRGDTVLPVPHPETTPHTHTDPGTHANATPDPNPGADTKIDTRAPRADEEIPKPRAKKITADSPRGPRAGRV